MPRTRIDVNVHTGDEDQDLADAYRTLMGHAASLKSTLLARGFDVRDFSKIEGKYRRNVWSSCDIIKQVTTTVNL